MEKTFTATVAGPEELRDLARAEGVFAMEAMWTRVLPAYVTLRELIKDGAIGEVRSVQADLWTARRSGTDIRTSSSRSPSESEPEKRKAR